MQSRREDDPLGSDEATLDPGSGPGVSAARGRDPSLAPLAQRYDILGEAGRGGMGVVYRARDRETGDLVALKVIHPAIARRPEVIERFKSELLLARKITHKNVCRTYELLRFGDLVVISMEYVEGESLASILARFGGVPLRRGLEWTAQVCSALSEAHSQGIVHRDLKPENIMITANGTAKVMDFGIARSLEAGADQAKSIVGTPGYMSPEQAEGKPAGVTSDIYSLGLILYEMFTGARAFAPATAGDQLHRHIHEAPLPPREVEPWLPPFLDRAIRKCLAKNPERRFQTIADLQAALGEQTAEESRPAEQLELPSHFLRWQRSDWALLALALVGLFVFLALFARTSLASRSQVAFDRSILRRIAEEHARRAGAPVEGTPEIIVMQYFSRYEYLARQAGSRTALEFTNNPVLYWFWLVSWPNRTKVAVDNRGNLVSLSRSFSSETGALLPPDEARPLAERALRDFFGREGGLRLESAILNDKWYERAAASFSFLDASDYRGLTRRYTVRLVGREIAYLSDVFSVPMGYAAPPTALWQIMPSGVFWFCAFTAGFLQRRRVADARWKTVLVGGGVVVGAWWGWLVSSGGPMGAILPFFIGLAAAVYTYFLLIALECNLRRAVPAKLATLARLFHREALSGPCGLAILRGSFIGLAILGTDAMLVWLGAARLGMRLDEMEHITVPSVVFLGSAWPSAHASIKSLSDGLEIGAMLPFLAAFLARFLKRAWVVVGATALTAALLLPGPLLSLAAVQPYHWKLVLLFADCLLLAWTFARFDMLTLCAAVFAFAFCWHNYLLLLILQPAGAEGQWLAFALWPVALLATAALAFWPALCAARRRITAAFE
jgi:serine/threonine protein kinase